jgi:hypothetical protein
MPDSSQDRAIGRLEGKLDALIENVAQSQKSSGESRAKIYAKLDHLTTSTDKIARLEERIAAIEPVAAEFNKWRERGIGALMLITFFSAALGAAITAAWKKVVAVVAG